MPKTQTIVVKIYWNASGISIKMEKLCCRDPPSLPPNVNVVGWEELTRTPNQL